MSRVELRLAARGGVMHEKRRRQDSTTAERPSRHEEHPVQA